MTNGQKEKILYGLIFFLLVAIPTLLMVCVVMEEKLAKEAFDKLTNPTGFMNQVSVDWASPPLLTIEVTS